jgi:hypothetical protein
VDVDEDRNRVVVAERTNGNWFIVHYDLLTQSPTPIASHPIGLLSVHDIAVMPYGACLPVNYCTSGISTNVCTPTMSANGTPSASATSGFVLTASATEGQRMGLIFYGISGRNSAHWGGTSTSYLCVKAPAQRMGVSNSGGSGGTCTGTISVDWLAYLATHPNALGQPMQAGTVVNAQCWYRDPPAFKSTNLSDGLEFTTLP